jgi:hypothetical protein
MGGPGFGTPVRRRCVNNSVAMSSIQGSMALPRQSSTPGNSTLINPTKFQNNLDSQTVIVPGTSSVETITTCRLNSTDLSQPIVSRSFDPFPQSEVKHTIKRDAKSLEDCTMTVSILPPTPPNSYQLPNGDTVHEEVVPLIPPKRWKSLEDGFGLLENGTDNNPLEVTDAKKPKGFLKTCLVGLLNSSNVLKGTGSQVSLRKNVYSLPGITRSNPFVNNETQYPQLSNGNDVNMV